MSKVTFETELNDEALGALKSYLAKRNEQLDMRLSEQLEKLYAATVPAAVREYLGEKNGTPAARRGQGVPRPRPVMLWEISRLNERPPVRHRDRNDRAEPRKSGGDPGGIFWNAGGTHRRQL